VPSIQAVDLVLLVGGAISIAVSTGVAVRLLKLGSQQLTMHMGQPSWDFTKSWASNLTVTGGVLSTLLVAGTLPDKTYHLSKQQFAIMTAFCTAIVTLAPLIYNSLRQLMQSQTAPDGSGLQYRGFVWSFLLASGLTLCGVYGQIVVLCFLVDEFQIAHLLPTTTTWAFLSALFVVAILLGFYAVQTMYWTVIAQSIPAAGMKGFDPDFSSKRWSLL
jgi:hypothetical protein